MRGGVQSWGERVRRHKSTDSDGFREGAQRAVEDLRAEGPGPPYREIWEVTRPREGR